MSDSSDWNRHLSETKETHEGNSWFFLASKGHKASRYKAGAQYLEQWVTQESKRISFLRFVQLL